MRTLKMKKESELLRNIERLPEPRHLFVLPDGAEPRAMDRLMDQGYLTCAHHQRDKDGALSVAMHLQLTPKAGQLLEPPAGTRWPQLAWKGSLAGASLTGMSLLVLYIA